MITTNRKRCNWSGTARFKELVTAVRLSFWMSFSYPLEECFIESDARVCPSLFQISPCLTFSPVLRWYFRPKWLYHDLVFLYWLDPLTTAPLRSVRLLLSRYLWSIIGPKVFPFVLWTLRYLSDSRTKIFDRIRMHQWNCFAHSSFVPPHLEYKLPREYSCVTLSIHHWDSCWISTLESFNSVRTNHQSQQLLCFTNPVRIYS